MSTETTVINIDSLNMNVITDDQVHHVYEELSEVDKASADNLATAEAETASSNYTAEDNNVIEATEEIPGVNVTPASIPDIVETEKDIKSVLDMYDLKDESAVQMLNLIEEYKAGNTSNLYSRMPKQMQDMVNGFVLMEETGGDMNPKRITAKRNSIAKMLIDDFINDAKISASVDEYQSEMASTINEMNTEYDKMLVDAIDGVFNKIEEIRTTNPEHADRVESVKDAFDRATSFEKQLEFAKHTSANKFNKFLSRFKDDVYYFNKRVNSNTFGVKVNNIEDLVPIIKLGLPQYTEDDIKKFIICICRTIENTDDLAGIAYEYRMISSIYRYKFTNIDDKGEIIFKNISEVIDVILS